MGFVPFEVFPSPAPVLRAQAEAQGSRRALVELPDGDAEGESVSYRDLDLRALAIAAELQRRGAKGSRVLLVFRSPAQFTPAFLGCLYAGMVAVPCPPAGRNRNKTRLRSILSDCDANLAICDEEQDLPIRQIVGVPERNKAWDGIIPDADDVAMLQYTSGSTGDPKGVILTHGNLAANLAGMRAAFGMAANSVTVTWLPFHHDMGLIGSLLYPLWSGSQVVIMPPAAFLQRPARWLSAITRYGGTHAAAPNFAYDLCVRAIPEDVRTGLNLSSWTVACNGAEPVLPATMQRFSDAFRPHGFQPAAFLPCYGLAESVVLAHAGGVSTGDIRIVDPESGSDLKNGVEGEIWIAGPSVSPGYWGKQELTAETFGAQLNGHGPYLRTGDLGAWRNGELTVTGRIKDLIIIRGVNHYPQDIEATVAESHSALEPNSGAAFSVTVNGEERLVILQEVSRRHWRSFAADEVLRAIRSAVAEEHQVQPHAVLLLRPQSIPKTTSGKIQRRSCRDAFLEERFELLGEWRRAEVESGAVHAEMEQWLAGRIAEYAGVPASEIVNDRPIAEYGLDSQAAVRLAGEIEERIGRRVHATLIYDYPTISAIARFLENRSSGPQQSTTQTSEPIAIIGIGCRFPGAENLAAYRDLLRTGREAVSDVPPTRWDASLFYDPEPAKPGRMNTSRGAFLDEVDGFDASFFDIAPREAVAMDPQQRLWMEVAWEALEDAGQPPLSLAGSKTGVFAGQSFDDYQRLSLSQGLESVDAYTGLGCSRPASAARVSHFLGLRGPAIHVDSACSSSLLAIHLACQSLRAGECDIALAGGVNLMLAPDSTVALCQLRALAPDGRSKTFDAAADGYGRGEGCGVVVLKRLSDAEAAGDRIHAVIRGSAANHDGRTNGFTAPNGPAQEQLIQQALLNSGVDAADVGYVEAHGTGTLLGDPIEVNAIASVFGSRPHNRPLLIGSAKTNIGHLEGAAGVAGLIKVVIALADAEIPAHLNLQNPNPHIPWEQIPVRVVTSRTRWPDWHARRISGVSSFGMSGTNVHAVLEAPRERQRVATQDAFLLVLSARTATAVRDLIGRYEHHLQTAANLGDVCYTAAAGRSHFRFRAAVVAANANQMRERLREAEIVDTGSRPRFGAADSDYASLSALAAVYLQGADIHWKRALRGSFTAIPTYPFERRRYWLGSREPAHPLLTRRLPQPAHLSGHHVWETDLDLRKMTFLRGHRISGNVMFPVSGYIEIARAASRDVLGAAPVRLSDLHLHQPLAIPEDSPRTLQVTLIRNQQGAAFQTHSRAAAHAPWVLHATASLKAEP